MWETKCANFRTDHYMVRVDLTCHTFPEVGKGRWAMPNRVVDDRECQARAKALLETCATSLEQMDPNDRSKSNRQTSFEEFKLKVRDAGKAIGKTIGSIAKNKIKALNDERKRIQNNRNLTENDRDDQVKRV